MRRTANIRLYEHSKASNTCLSKKKSALLLELGLSCPENRTDLWKMELRSLVASIRLLSPSPVYYVFNYKSLDFFEMRSSLLISGEQDLMEKIEQEGENGELSRPEH